MKLPGRSTLLCAVAFAMTALAACTRSPETARENGAATPSLSDRVNRAATDVRQTAGEWSDKLAARSAALGAEVEELLASARSATADLGENTARKMEELAALMPEMEEQAGKLRQSSGDAARAAGDRLNTLVARAETLYREVTGRPPPVESSPSASPQP